MSERPLIALMALVAVAPAALAVPSLVEKVAAGVTVVRDDSGAFGGWEAGMGITHQSYAAYQAKKVLDLSDVPEAIWQATRQVRLSMYFDVRDYSWHDSPPGNGLDETYEIVVNGTARSYTTAGGAPIYLEGRSPIMEWYDFDLPKAEFVRGVNEVIIRKGPSGKNDDYLYLGIDNSLQRGNSYVTFDGEPWRQDKLTIPGGNGEYMVRLYLLQGDTTCRIGYRPGQARPLDDPSRLIQYAGAHGARVTSEGVALAPGQALRLEWDPGAFDILAPLRATLDLSGQAEVSWLDPADKPVKAEAEAPSSVVLPANRRLRPSGLVVKAVAETVTVRGVTVEGARSYHPRPPVVDMCPRVAGPAGKVKPRAPSCKQAGKGLLLGNGLLYCRFEGGKRLRLTSLYNVVTGTEMLRPPSKARLFLVEVEEKRYAGSEDFALKSLKATRTGFTAELALSAPTLAATFTATMEAEGLRLGLKLTNTGAAAVDFKLAFPHLEGLGISASPAEDYYFFPLGGGIFGDRAAEIRKGYGDYEALYQVMDVYSPESGGGMYLRVDDREGWHKVLALRKHVWGKGGEVVETPASTQLKVRPEYVWKSPLDTVPGTGLTVEYLRRTRSPGGSFSPAPAVLAAHPGDWRPAMAAYSAWAHRVWKFRPYPSRLKSVRNMLSPGWAQDILFKDGKYRTDIVEPPRAGRSRTMSDSVELMSWWDWSPLGPFQTPWDQVKEKFGDGVWEMWQPYLVKDPVTGQTLWNNQPGDYKGYNERFGGLPAFRQAIETYRGMGALVTLYTDPFRLDDACETGRQHGRRWTVIGKDGKPSTGYEVWNPCHDLPEVRQWVAETMGRVMRETGADGIRLDEYGHSGWACYSPDHEHSFAEPGLTQWNKAVTEAARMVHAEMDKVRPGLVLTTEFPAYDYMMPYLDGCITYDYSVVKSPLRPLECNLQRFYFPECKAYELDLGYDAGDKKKFWNAVESFGRYYPLPYYVILSENEDVYQRAGGHDPLLWTPGNAARVYVNRFAGNGKALYHLFNATGHTFEGTALAVKLAAGQHLFDMLNCVEVEPARLPGTKLSPAGVYLPRNEVACVAQLTRRLTVARQGEALAVTVQAPAGEWRLAVASREGETLLEQPAKAGRNVLDLSKLPAEARPACVKLLRAGQLVDVAQMP